MTADGDDSSSDEAEPARQAPPAPPAPPARSVEVAARSFRGGGPHEGDPQQRSVVVEGPLTIQVKGGQSYTIMRTPGDDRELAVGFLFTEGLIAGTGDILTLADCLDEENVIQVALAVGPSGDATRNIPVSSSCGMCGREDFEALVAELEPPPPARCS